MAGRSSRWLSAAGGARDARPARRRRRGIAVGPADRGGPAAAGRRRRPRSLRSASRRATAHVGTDAGGGLRAHRRDAGGAARPVPAGAPDPRRRTAEHALDAAPGRGWRGGRRRVAPSRARAATDGEAGQHPGPPARHPPQRTGERDRKHVPTLPPCRPTGAPTRACRTTAAPTPIRPGVDARRGARSTCGRRSRVPDRTPVAAAPRRWRAARQRARASAVAGARRRERPATGRTAAGREPAHHRGLHEAVQQPGQEQVHHQEAEHHGRAPPAGKPDRPSARSSAARVVITSTCTR